MTKFWRFYRHRGKPEINLCRYRSCRSQYSQSQRVKITWNWIVQIKLIQLKKVDSGELYRDASAVETASKHVGCVRAFKPVEIEKSMTDPPYKLI
ncbi:MAG: hypothetical protein M3N42_07625 [Cyanobacteriota bacterium]|nr:hypothetical protein [Cyanobacteriota bacterium]